MTRGLGRVGFHERTPEEIRQELRKMSDVEHVRDGKSLGKFCKRTVKGIAMGYPNLPVRVGG
jgi:hypothetical protein